MLATVSGILAGAGINIGGLHLGRTETGADALTVVATDQVVGDEVKAKINAIEGITSVRRMTL